MNLRRDRTGPGVCGRPIKDEVKAYKAGKKQDRLTDARTAFCAFNVLEAFVLLSERPWHAACWVSCPKGLE